MTSQGGYDGLNQWMAGADSTPVHEAAASWNGAATSLNDFAIVLQQQAPEIEKIFNGKTGAAARAAFEQAAARLTAHAQKFSRGSGAYTQAGDAIDKVKTGVKSLKQPPAAPAGPMPKPTTTTPTSEEVNEQIRWNNKQTAHDTAVQQRDADSDKLVTHADTEYAAATKTMWEIAGTQDDKKSSSPGGSNSGPGGSDAPTSTPAYSWGGGGVTGTGPVGHPPTSTPPTSTGPGGSTSGGGHPGGGPGGGSGGGPGGGTPPGGTDWPPSGGDPNAPGAGGGPGDWTLTGGGHGGAGHGLWSTVGAVGGAGAASAGIFASRGLLRGGGGGVPGVAGVSEGPDGVRGVGPAGTRGITAAGAAAAAEAEESALAGGRAGAAGPAGTGRGGAAMPVGSGAGGRGSDKKRKRGADDLWDDGEDWIDDEASGTDVVR